MNELSKLNQIKLIEEQLKPGVLNEINDSFAKGFNDISIDTLKFLRSAIKLFPKLNSTSKEALAFYQIVFCNPDINFKVPDINVFENLQDLTDFLKCYKNYKEDAFKLITSKSKIKNIYNYVMFAAKNYNIDTFADLTFKTKRIFGIIYKFDEPNILKVKPLLKDIKNTKNLEDRLQFLYENYVCKPQEIPDEMLDASLSLEQLEFLKTAIKNEWNIERCKTFDNRTCKMISNNAGIFDCASYIRFIINLDKNYSTSFIKKCILNYKDFENEEFRENFFLKNTNYTDKHIKYFKENYPDKLNDIMLIITNPYFEKYKDLFEKNISFLSKKEFFILAFVLNYFYDNDLKPFFETKFSEKQKEALIKSAKSSFFSKLDILNYIDESYSCEQIIFLSKQLNKNRPIKNALNPSFSLEHMEHRIFYDILDKKFKTEEEYDTNYTKDKNIMYFMYSDLEQSLDKNKAIPDLIKDVTLFSRIYPQFNFDIDKMVRNCNFYNFHDLKAEVDWGLKNNIDIGIYYTFEYSYEQQDVIKEALIAGKDISKILDPSIKAKDMREILDIKNITEER